MKKLIISIITLILIIPIILASDPEMYYKQGDEVGLQIPCLNNNTYCSHLTECYITIINPNTLKIVNNQTMNGENGYYNYTLNGDLTNTIGEYQVTTVCNDQGETGYSAFSFFITNENINYSNTQVVVIGLGIIIFLLIYISINFDKEQYLLKLLFFFFAIGMLPLIPKAIIWGDTTLTTFYTATLWISRIFYVYVFLFFIYKVFIEKIIDKWHLWPKESKK